MVIGPCGIDEMPLAFASKVAIGLGRVIEPEDIYVVYIVLGDAKRPGPTAVVPGRQRYGSSPGLVQVILVFRQCAAHVSMCAPVVATQGAPESGSHPADSSRPPPSDPETLGSVPA